MVWLTIIGSASIQIRADDKYFEPDVRKAVARLKNLEIQLRVDADISKASKKIRDLRYRITSKDAVLKIDADVAKAEAKMAAFLSKFLKNDLEFNAVANTQGANTALNDLRNRFVSTRVPFTATANTAAARAGLIAASRDRTTVIHALLDPASVGALKSALNIISGTLPFEKIKGALIGVVTGFEGLTLKAGIATTALGSIGAAALTAGANLFSIARDAAQAGGVIALLPAGIFALTTILKVNKMAWEGFGEAAKDNSAKANEALAKLPPEAQKAAVAMRGVREQIQKPVQKAFWEAVGTSLQDMVQAQLPSVIEGMSRIASSMGGFTKEVFNTIQGIGDFNDIFENVSVSIGNMVGGIKPAIEALATFTGIGSRYLPQFGTWVAELGAKFGAFTERAEASGQIVSWINTGIQRLQELGSIASSTVGIFNGLANAAEMSGASGLTELADGMKNVANIVNGEPFQSRLISILEGARSGTEKMGEGFRTLTGLIGESADGIGIFLDKAGEVAGLTFKNITALFDGTGLGSGLMEMLDGLSEAMVILEPGFGDLGATIGDLGEIAGELFVNTASGLNMLFDTVNSVVAALKDGIIGAMPVLNGFVQALLSVASGPIIGLAEIVGNVLEVFADMPQVVQFAIAAIGLFILLGPKIEAMWARVRTAAATSFAGLAGDVDSAGNHVQSSFGRSADNIRDSWRRVGTELSEGRMLAGYVTNMERIQSVTGATARAIGTSAGEGLRMAGGGLMNALGGPWGAAIAGATVLVGLYASAQQEARAKVDELKGSLDKVTGSFTGDSRRILASDIIDFESGTDAWSEMWRFGRKTAVENLDEIGLSVDEVTKKLTDPSTGQEYGDAWQKIGSIATDSIGGTLEINEELARSVNMTTDELEAMGAQDLATLAHGIGQAAKSAETAKREIEDLANRTNTNTIAAAQLAKNYDILSRATSSASEKFSALKQNIDLLSNGQQTAHAAARDYAQSLDDQKKAMSELIEKHGGVVDSTGRVNDAFRNTLLNADSSFSVASQGARDFSQQMDVAADSILKQGTAALDAALKSGKAMPEAMAAAMNAMEPSVATLRGSLSTLGFDAGQVDAIIKQLGLDPEKLTAAMSVDTAKAEIDVARLKLAMSSYASGNYTAVLAALPDQAKEAIGSAMGLGDAFKNGNYEAILAALDGTAVGKEAALASLLSVSNGDYTAALKALNFVADPVANATAQALGYKNQDYTAALEATNLTGGPAADATAIARGFANGDYLATLKALNITQGPVSEATGAAAGFSRTDFTAALKAADSTAGGRAAAAAAIASTTGANYTAWIKAAADQGSINGVSGSLNALTATRYATIIAQYKEIGRPVGLAMAQDGFANGGIMGANGIRQFANGGILNGIVPKVKAFAGGGMESHVAQIARGAWPVRVWAEPETGGEAYLPLHPSKRKRSLEVLRQVMREFGLGQFIQFDSGGFLPAANSMTPAVVSSRYANTMSPVGQVTAAMVGGAAPNISMTVYPSERMDETQIGESAAKQLYWNFLNRNR